jgi:Ca2+-binding EF-hand superfamily protein
MMLLPIVILLAAHAPLPLVDYVGFPDHTGKLFREIDVDNDKALSTEEIEAYMSTNFISEGSTAAPREPRILDMDYDGKFTYLEFAFCEINIFTALDTNSDLKLSVEELQARPSFLSTHAESIIKDFDEDKDGFLHWSEMHSLFPTFLEIDANSDSQLSKTELEMYLQVRPKLSNQQRSHMVAGMLDKKDADKDGLVSWPEFKPVVDLEDQGDEEEVTEEIIEDEEEL